MTKKKKSWQSDSLKSVEQSESLQILDILARIMKNEDAEFDDCEELYDILDDVFERICALNDNKDALTSLGYLIVCGDAFAEENLSETYSSLDYFYDDVADAFAKRAKLVSDRKFLVDLLHDLAVHVKEGDFRECVLYSAHAFLSEKELRELVDEVVGTVRERDLENAERICETLIEMTVPLDDPELVERLTRLKDPDFSVLSKIDVANAYYCANQVERAHALLDEIRDPEKWEQDYLDLKVAILLAEGKRREGIQTAELLYEKYPSTFYLANLCSIVSPERRKKLLDEHEKFRLGDSLNTAYVQTLVDLEEFDRISRYLDAHEDSIPQMKPEDLEMAAAYLEKNGRPDLAKRLAPTGGLETKA